MPSILFRNLSPNTRLAMPIIQSGVRGGLSTNAIERSVRAMGIPITRKTTLNPIVSELRRIEAQGVKVRNIRPGRPITVRNLPGSVGKMKTQYTYRYKITGYDANGEFIDRFAQVSTDNPKLLRRELDTLAERLVSAGGISDTLQDVEVKIDFGVQRTEL